MCFSSITMDKAGAVARHELLSSFCKGQLPKKPLWNPDGLVIPAGEEQKGHCSVKAELGQAAGLLPMDGRTRGSRESFSTQVPESWLFGAISLD